MLSLIFTSSSASASRVSASLCNATSKNVLIWYSPIFCISTVLCLVIQSCLTLWDSMDCSPPGSSAHGDSPGKNTGVGCHDLHQGIFPTQGSNPGLPHCRQILYCLSHQESPWILEWVAYFFSRGSSRPRNWTKVSCIAGGFFTSWAIRGTHTHCCCC